MGSGRVPKPNRQKAKARGGGGQKGEGGQREELLGSAR